MAAGLIRMLDEASWLFYGTLDHFCMLGTYVSFSEILLIDTGIHAKRDYCCVLSAEWIQLSI